MSEEEEDYMSEKFLSGIADVRSSLIQNKTKKRQLDIEAKQADHLKRQRDERLERTGANRNERLQESLKRPIEANNKGFQLLAKMGYTPGQALGKNEQKNGTAIENAPKHCRLTEPIAISIKTDRGGLGREAALLELSQKRHQLRQHRLQKASEGESLSTTEFRKRATQKAEERFMQGALRRCQLTCKNLDTEHNVTAEMPWFWPECTVETNEDEIQSEEKKVGENSSENVTETTSEKEPIEEYTTAEKMELLTSYLRISYRFCFWCGVHYQDQQDMDASCPGLSRDEH